LSTFSLGKNDLEQGNAGHRHDDDRERHANARSRSLRSEIFDNAFLVFSHDDNFISTLTSFGVTLRFNLSSTSSISQSKMTETETEDVENSACKLCASAVSGLGTPLTVPWK
jgi:hypothetical protein